MVRTVHPADAPASLRRLLTGATVPGRVIGVFPHAVYVVAEDGTTREVAGAAAPPTVVAVVTADGIRQPNALVIRATATCAPFGSLTAGLPATIGAGGVLIEGRGARLDARAARWSDRRAVVGRVDPAVLLTSTAALTRARLTGGRVHVDVEPRVQALATALQRGRLGEVAVTARALVGLGHGLTPSGDDVLAGLLAGAHAFTRGIDTPDLDRLLGGLWAAVAPDLADRTTTLSAALLAHAVAGEMAGPAADLATAMTTGRSLTEAHQRLLAVGHSSGQDLARGLELAGATVISLRSGSSLAPTTEPAGAPR